jgi:hypothetical protein
MSEIRWPEPFNEQGPLAEGKPLRAMGINASAREPCGYYRRCTSIRLYVEKRETAEMKIAVPKHFLMLIVVASMLAMLGCTDANESNPSDVSGFNYTSYYIAGFRVGNEGQDLSAGGPNISPKGKGRERSGGGASVCCIGIPVHWRRGMRLVVKWNVDKVLDGVHLGRWYTAATEVPPYGPHTYGFWVHFLPDDRIRVEIQDKPEMPTKPDDRDPYIVQGVLDPELNRK